MTDKPAPMTDDQLEMLRADLGRAGFGGSPCLLGNYQLSRLLASHDAEKAARDRSESERLAMINVACDLAYRFAAIRQAAKHVCESVKTYRSEATSGQAATTATVDPTAIVAMEEAIEATKKPYINS